jgi:hypothetical protein
MRGLGRSCRADAAQGSAVYGTSLTRNGQDTSEARRLLAQFEELVV